ncbi:MAG: Uncharacterised protein [Cryomorphaceae bacterium]|nr:MAG: Uncharacterised protein [Cryomorphaceae bacterium]
MKDVKRMNDTMDNNPTKIWNDRYSKTAYAYGTDPNEFFKAELAKLEPAGVLLPAEGEGRNAVHALKEGWNVVAFDQSEAARDKALKLAAEHGQQLEYAVADAQEYLCPVMVDVLAPIYLHPPGASRMEIYIRLSRFVAPGGHLIFEAFSEKNIGMGSGGPQGRSMCFTVEAVQQLFSDFGQLEVWEEKITLNEGLYHNGEAWVIRARGTK